MSYILNQNQKDFIQSLRDNGQYDLAYRYISEQIDGAVQNGDVSRETQRWFDWAAHINADDDSFINAYARNYAQIGAALDGVTLTNEDFQRGSDAIATDVLTGVISSGIIPTTPEDIVLTDISRGSVAMGTDVEDFPGTLIAGLLFDTPTIQNLILNDPNSSTWEKISQLTEQGSKHAAILGSIAVFGGADALKSLFQDPSRVADFFDALNDVWNDETLRDVLNEFFEDLVLDPLSNIPQWLQDALQPIFDTLGVGPHVVFYRVFSPLVLDLDGNGIDLTNMNGSNAYFDFWGDGYAKKTGWVARYDVRSLSTAKAERVQHNLKVVANDNFNFEERYVV